MDPFTIAGLAVGARKLVGGLFESARARRLERQANVVGKFEEKGRAIQGQADLAGRTAADYGRLSGTARQANRANTQSGINTAQAQTAQAAREIGGLSPAARLAQASMNSMNFATQRAGVDTQNAQQEVQDNLQTAQLKDRQAQLNIAKADNSLQSGFYQAGKAQAAARDADALISSGVGDIAGNLGQTAQNNAYSKQADKLKGILGTLTGGMKRGYAEGGMGTPMPDMEGRVMAESAPQPIMAEPGEVIVREDQIATLLQTDPQQFLDVLAEVAEPVGGRGLGDSEPNELQGRDIVLSNADLARMRANPEQAAMIFDQLFNKYESEQTMSMAREAQADGPAPANDLMAQVMEGLRQLGQQPSAEEVQQLQAMSDDELMDVLEVLQEQREAAQGQAESPEQDAVDPMSPSAMMMGGMRKGYAGGGMGDGAQMMSDAASKARLQAERQRFADQAQAQQQANLATEEQAYTNALSANDRAARLRGAVAATSREYGVDSPEAQAVAQKLAQAPRAFLSPADRLRLIDQRNVVAGRIQGAPAVYRPVMQP
jgi:hypothetical protein